MAGSYQHCVDDQGALRRDEDFRNMIENLGDAEEAIEEMYWMIRFLASECAQTHGTPESWIAIAQQVGPQ